MGQVIKKKLNGMSWWMKTSLVLLLTLISTVFMGEGLYKPNSSFAAPKTYYVNAITPGVNVGTNGTTTMTTAVDIVVATPSVANANRAYTNTTVPTGTTRWRISQGAAATNTGAEFYRAYTPLYASSMSIAANATAYADFYMRTTGGTATIKATLYEYNDTNGIVGAAKGTASFTANTAISTRQTLNASFGNTSFTVAANNRLMVIYNFDSATGRPCLLWGQSASATPSGYQSFTVDETAAATAGALAVSVATQTVAEAVGNATVSVTRTGGTTGAVTVAYATADGTALAGQDYTSTTGTLSWAAGDATAKTITIPIINDTYDELSETFTVNLSTPTNGATLGTATQTVTITDDDATPTIGFTATTSTGNKAITPATFTVSLSSVSSLSTTVVYSTTNGTAAAGVDYTATSGTLNIPALSASGTISVPISAASNGGTFTITISTPTNSTLRAGFTTHTYTITSVAASTITRCDGCHGYSASIGAGATFTDGASRNDAGKFQGSHNTHVIGQVMNCSGCHVTPATTTSADFGHSKGTITMAPSISGGTYSVASPITVSNTFTPGTCNGTTCHGSVYATTAGASPNWGAGGSGCVSCHNGTPGAFIVSGGAPDTGGHTMHMPHVINGCADCHTGATATAYASALHGDGSINVANGYNGGLPATKRTAGGTYYTCTTASCHASPYSSTPATTTAWRSGTATCAACHNGTVGTFINYSAPTTPNNAIPQQSGPNTGSHSAHMNYGRYVCQECHDGAVTGTSGGLAHGNTLINVTGGQGGGYGTTAAGTPVAKHTAGSGYLTCTTACHTTSVPTWGQLTLRCIDCHAASIVRTKGRPGKTLAAVMVEFGKAAGHRKTPRTAVTDLECIACHLEGNGTTHITSKFHADGNIDLRDPDALATDANKGETAITNLSGGAFTFQRFSTSYAAGSRTATGATNNADIAQVISVMFCVKCHDANGAQNTTAYTTGGTNAMPFGGVQLGAAYTATLNAIGTQGLINVATQFATTNSSRHPVLGSNTKDYPDKSRLAVPYNNIGIRNPTGSTGHVTASSVVMNCFDCHNASGTPLTLRTVAAHGNNTVPAVGYVTLRGSVYTTSPTLCTTCHTGYTGTPGTATSHGNGSAFITPAQPLDGGEFMSTICHNCHGSNTNLTVPARPQRAQDYHGNNALVGGGLWPTVNARPVSFIRGWSGTAYHRGYRLSGTSGYTTGSATCGNGTCPGGGTVGNGTTTTYTPGGSY